MSRAVIFHYTDEDAPYLGFLKAIVRGRTTATYLDNTKPVLFTEMAMKSKKHGNAVIVSTSKQLLSIVFPFADNPTIDEYAGNYINYKGVDVLFINPLKQLVTVNYGKFVFERFLSKILAPENFIPEPEFQWEYFQPSQLDDYVEFFQQCTIIGIDSETVRNDPLRSISCIGFCGAILHGNKITLRTVVVPMDDMFNVEFCRLLCDMPAPKVFQNGKYDIAYFFRYNIIVRNYAFDTINLFHSWFCELPKDLGFVSTFMLRNYVYHKNTKGLSKHEFYGYNAKDCYVTVMSAIALLMEIPKYAETNFLIEFPIVFPCILSETTGIKWDQQAANDLKQQVKVIMEKELLSLRKMVACPQYNPNSPQQTQRLFQILGSRDVKSTDKVGKDKVAFRHPLNRVLMDKIINYRENMKVNSSYFKDTVSWNGRCFYALNPHGTDTARLSSKESQFWCGLSIHTIKRDEDGEEAINVKDAFVADEDFWFGEADYSQAESRGTAYLSGDLALIDAVDNPATDFHGVNASRFFGIPYNEIIESKCITIDEDGNEIPTEHCYWVHKILRKPIRQLSKNTNHGANYNMGPAVMVDTMGIKNVLMAKKILGLPEKFSPINVTEYLLAAFNRTYHIMKGPYYDKIKADIRDTGFLVSPTGWTRKCFGNPDKSKLDLNSYVAHPSQNLNAQILNKAVLNVFYNVWLHNKRDFKFCAQVHDSLLFQYRKSRPDLPWQVADCMKIPVDVKDTFGITRTLIVPTDIKGEGKRWSSCKPLKRPKNLKAY